MKQKVVVRTPRWFRGVLFLLVIGCFCGPAGFTFGATDSETSSDNTESRRMDFWLSEWTVTYPGMPASASSNVYLELDKCLIVESWDGGKGHNGENMLAYSSDDRELAWSVRG